MPNTPPSLQSLQKGALQKDVRFLSKDKPKPLNHEQLSYAMSHGFFKISNMSSRRFHTEKHLLKMRSQ